MSATAVKLVGSDGERPSLRAAVVAAGSRWSVGQRQLVCFMRAFLAKAPLEAVVERIPVKVILNPEAGLLGAVMYAASER